MPDIQRLLVENIQPAPHRRGWHGGPTAVGTLRGVTAKQAVWRPAGGRHSIWSLTLHIAYWKYAVRRRLEGRSGAGFGRSPANWPTVPSVGSESAWGADVALLREQHRRLLEAVAGVPVSKYDKVPPGAKQWSYSELIVGIAQHDAYHTGQIQMLKRLYRGR